MFLLRIVVALLVALAIVGIATQILYPLVSGTVLFPAFRRKRAGIQDEIAETQALIDDQELLIKLARMKKELAEHDAALAKATAVNVNPDPPADVDPPAPPPNPPPAPKV